MRLAGNAARHHKPILDSLCPDTTKQMPTPLLIHHRLTRLPRSARLADSSSPPLGVQPLDCSCSNLSNTSKRPMFSPAPNRVSQNLTCLLRGGGNADGMALSSPPPWPSSPPLPAKQEIPLTLDSRTESISFYWVRIATDLATSRVLEQNPQ